MESGAHAIGGSFPRFEQFRMGINLIPPPENAGLYFRADFILVLRLDDFIFVLVKPIGKLTALHARQLQRCNKVFSICSTLMADNIQLWSGFAK